MNKNAEKLIKKEKFLKLLAIYTSCARVIDNARDELILQSAFDRRDNTLAQMLELVDLIPETQNSR